MSPYDEEILGFLPDHPCEEQAISQHTRRVAELLRVPGALEHWRAQSVASFVESRKRHELNKAWRKKLDDYLILDGIFDFGQRRAPNRQPEGWAWHGTTWVPPGLRPDDEPFVGPIVPFSSQHAPSLADCYFALAVVHDSERTGAGKINPFAADDTAGQLCWHAHFANLDGLRTSDRITLDDCLARAETDLGVVGEPTAAKVDGAKRMSVEEANAKAMKLARKQRAGFFALSIRQQAELIGCSFKTWKKTPFFKTAQEKRPAGKLRKTSSPKTVSLTDGLEAVTGEGGKDQTLQDLIADQEADSEPSSLESRPRKIHSHKRL